MITKFRVDELKRRIAWLEKINKALIKRVVTLNKSLSKYENKTKVR